MSAARGKLKAKCSFVFSFVPFSVDEHEISFTRLVKARGIYHPRLFYEELVTTHKSFFEISVFFVFDVFSFYFIVCIVST